VDQFHTSARNFLDHDVVGDSGIFIPLTDLGAIIHGTEVTVRSPMLFHVAQSRVAYSNQIGQGIGPITGGLLEFTPTGNFPLDHDQRNTVTSVLSLRLPGRPWITTAYQFGSGFLNGNGPMRRPPSGLRARSDGADIRISPTSAQRTPSDSPPSIFRSRRAPRSCECCGHRSAGLLAANELPDLAHDRPPRRANRARRDLAPHRGQLAGVNRL
jgi:hypothetical protein